MKYLPPIITAFICTAFAGVIIAHAQNYAPLAPLPGTINVNDTTAGVGTTNISLYLSGMIKLLIALGAALAVLFAIIGGTQYVAAGITPDAKSGAKERITNALIGLAIILTSYLLLNSINPKLVDVSFELEKVSITPPPSVAVVVSCGSITPTNTLLDTPEAQAMEAGATVIFNSSDPTVQANLNKLKAEVDKLQNALHQIGASATVNSAYRPYSYQKHLYEIYSVWVLQGLQNNNEPGCATIKSIIGNEYRKHGLGRLVANPDSGNAPHVNGTGVDITLVGEPYELVNALMISKGIKLEWQGLSADDKWHFNLR